MYYVLDQKRQATDGPFSNVRDAAKCVDAKNKPEQFYTSSRWMMAKKNPRYPGTVAGNKRLLDDLANNKGAGGASE